jgi:hypothetical protein
MLWYTLCLYNRNSVPMTDNLTYNRNEYHQYTILPLTAVNSTIRDIFMVV